MNGSRCSYAPRHFRLHTGNKSVAVILFAIYLLSLSTVIYTDSYEATLEQQRKLTYGAWHAAVYDVDEDSWEAISSHATVATAGRMEIVGYAVDKEGGLIGGVGYIDESLAEIGNISLLDGHFPAASDEIAVEASFLTRLGYSYELGQTISLPIVQDVVDGEVKNYEFTLTGVVKNYSTLWKSNNYWLTSFFLEQNTLPVQQQYIFVELLPQYVEYADSLIQLCPDDSSFVKNDFTYLQYSDQNAPQMDRAMLQTIIILAGCVAVVILINNELNKRKESFISMRMLGATRGQIIKLFFQGKAVPVLASSLIGILCGLGLPYLLYLLLRTRSDAAGLCFALNARHITRTVALLAAGITVAFGFGLIRLFQIPLRGKPQLQVASGNFHRRRRLNEKNLFSILNLAHFKSSILSTALTFATALFVFISAYQAWSAYEEYDFFCRNYPSDYSYGTLTILYPPTSAMSEDTLNEIKTAYGVKTVQAYSISDYYGAVPSGDYDTEYAEMVREFLANTVGARFDAPMYAPVIGISDDLYPFFAESVDTQLLSGDSLETGDVILYLPDFFVVDNNLINVDLASATQESGTILSDSKIAVGDTLTIDVNGESHRLRIAGIIHAFDDDFPTMFHPGRPNSLICNMETYRAIFGACQYGYVLVYGDDAAIQYQTDVELSKISSPLPLSNRRVERMEQRQRLGMRVFLALILSVSGFLMAMLVRFGLYSAMEKENLARYRALYQLGMSRKDLWRWLTRNATADTLTGSTMALFVLMCWRYMQERDQVRSFANYVFSGAWSLFRDAIERCVAYTDWFFVLCMFFFVVAINLIVLISYNRRYALQEANFYNCT